jgi:hypothetical protein
MTAPLCASAWACDTPVSVCPHDVAGAFAIVTRARPAQLLIDPSADPALVRAADGFAHDLAGLAGTTTRRVESTAGLSGNVVIAGVLGHSPAIDGLVRAGKIQASDIAGEWEAYRQIVVDHPYPNVARALVIVGSDRRGVVFGLYDLSEKMGVSPWSWWADVPVPRRSDIFITAGTRRDQPKVRYRGFFINDEDPGFSSWTQKHFGGANANAYAHVFDLLLRLKGNYLWPAMWAPRAFNDDDPQNMVLADKAGVVMGTSHHEPMTRAQDEWHRHVGDGVTGGKWDYTANAANLRTFWRGGIERMMSKGDGTPFESLVTVGMRGDGDEAMSGSTATGLLESIVAAQRKIIADVTHKPADQTPQVWALYKEVQDYYDKGMKVPDDVTLLFSDDNWGQIRRLPEDKSTRTGGYGVYYHFDYVGAPRNYKWLNTVQIEKTWQQMDLAYERGARNLWIVNVGDIKPVELPLSFFMKQAWNPTAMTPEALERYPAEWARLNFGPRQASSIAALVTRYSQLAARRKPELVDATSFPLGSGAPAELDGGEFGRRVAELDTLQTQMLAVRKAVPQEQRYAFFQLVEHPILALANLYRLYYAVAWNHQLAAARDARANAFADQAEAAFKRDRDITEAYHALNGRKWDGMMAQTHIGYTGWQQPERQMMPSVQRVPGMARPIVFLSARRRAPTDGIGIDARDYIRAVGGKGLAWRTIAHLGPHSAAVVALPQGRMPTTQADGVRLEYAVTTNTPGALDVQLHLVPTLDVTGGGKLRVGVSIDDGPMVTITDRLTPAPNDTTTDEQRAWNAAVENNTRSVHAVFPAQRAGRHIVKVWRIDDNVVLHRVEARTTPAAQTSTGIVADPATHGAPANVARVADAADG